MGTRKKSFQTHQQNEAGPGPARAMTCSEMSGNQALAQKRQKAHEGRLAKLFFQRRRGIEWA